VELTPEERLAETKEGLKSLLEDGFMRSDRSDPDWLIIVLDAGGALETEVSYSLSVMVEQMIDYAETEEDYDAIRELAATLLSMSKRMTRVLKDMEGT
jgi:hypothetical protein